MCADGGKHDQRHWLQTTRFTTSRCMFEDKQSYQTVDSRILRRRGNIPFQGLFSLLALMKCAQNSEALDLCNGGRVEFWDTYNALKLKTKAKKEKQARQKKTKKHQPSFGPQQTGRPSSFASASVLPLPARAWSDGKGHTRMHYLKGENRVSS